MLTAVKFAFLLLLFLLVFVFVKRLLEAAVRQSAVRFRLRYVRDASLSSRLARLAARYNVVYRHVADLLESMRSKMNIGTFFFLTAVLSLAGFVFGYLFFRSVKGVVSVTLVAGAIPYVTLRMRLVGRQMRTRLEFLPAVELFYQYYLVTGQANVRTALKATLAENRMTYPMRPVFEQLYHNLSTNRDPEDSLRIFSLSLGHVWGDYFANILRVALLEGSEISESLKELISDMRRAQRSDQAERNRLLEIRIANFSSALFLLVLVLVNFKINPDNAYRYYLLDPAGRNLLLDAVLLIFASFLMGIYLSIRRM